MQGYRQHVLDVLPRLEWLDDEPHTHKLQLTREQGDDVPHCDGDDVSDTEQRRINGEGSHDSSDEENAAMLEWPRSMLDEECINGHKHDV